MAILGVYLLYVIYDSIYNLRPCTVMREVMSHTIYKHQFGTGYSRCHILATLNTYERIIGAMNY
jgi:hypothetical protein